VIIHQQYTNAHRWPPLSRSSEVIDLLEIARRQAFQTAGWHAATVRIRTYWSSGRCVFRKAHQVTCQAERTLRADCPSVSSAETWCSSAVDSGVGPARSSDVKAA